MDKPIVSVIMGSQSDWITMREAVKILAELGINYETKIVSAHRTPNRLFSFAESIISKKIKVIIAGAGGAAHLPGMIASKTIIPVIGVPIKTESLSGLDSLYSIVQMPSGYPVGTMAIGKPGATNAALFAASILAINNKDISTKLTNWRIELTNSVPETPHDE